MVPSAPLQSRTMFEHTKCSNQSLVSHLRLGICVDAIWIPSVLDSILRANVPCVGAGTGNCCALSDYRDCSGCVGTALHH